jgi:hypothetical protein
MFRLQEDRPAYARKAARSRFHKGSCVGLRAWAIARLVEVKQPQGASKARGKAGAGSSSSAAAAGAPSKVLLQRYYRPEDISKDTAYR